MATQLKTISDSIGKVFENQSYVFSYGSESISYNDSLAIRGAILAIEFKLDFVASYSWGDDEDIKTRTVYEYQNISVNPATVLNSVKGSGSYELVEEWEEYNWDDAKWQSNHSYTGDVTTYSEKYYVDLSKLLNSSYAVDITSFGSNFGMACERTDMSYNINVSKIQNAAECTYANYVNSSISYADGAFIKPAIKPTVSTSRLDDVVTKIIDNNGKEYTGQAVIDWIVADQESAK